MKFKIPFINKTLEIRSNLSNPAQWLIESLAGIISKSGAKINAENSLKVTAVFACVRLLATTIASLPLPLYKSLEKGKTKAINHPLYKVLHDIPNPECTSYDFWSILMFNVLIYGRGIAEIVRDGAGNIIELWPIPTYYVVIRRDSNNKLLYDITAPGIQTYTLRFDQIFEIKSSSFDGVNVFKPLELAREAIGLSLATEEFGARFFSNGANVSGIAEYPGALKPDSFERFKQSFREAYSGLSNSARVLFLEQGLKFTRLTMGNNESQMIETRKHQVNEVARFFNVPPHMIMDLERATFSNIEQQSINFVTYSLNPWLVCIEQSIKRDLLTPKEQNKYFAKFNVNALLRADFKTRMEGYHFLRQDGILSANDIRELEDLNPIPAEEGGDDYLINGNMVPIRQAITGGGQLGNGTQNNNNAGTKNQSA